MLLYLRQEVAASACTTSSTRTRCRTTAWTPTPRTPALGLPEDGRDYTAAAQMLAALGVRKIDLLSNNPGQGRAAARARRLGTPPRADRVFATENTCATCGPRWTTRTHHHASSLVS
ncbi:hypothetical protein [Kutzneria kofuensis]|uniref:hypothetical protein n=1 Tax=Kutzneria kofuensis TaxID=103725 RepID=UPI0031EA66A6